MALTTNAKILEFASAQTVISDAADASDPDFSLEADATALTLTDVVVLGDALLDITCQTAPAVGDAVHLYRRDKDILGEGVNANIPDASYKESYVGSFELASTTARQYVALSEIPLSHDQEFYIEYDLTATNGTVTNPTVVKVRPKAPNGKS